MYISYDAQRQAVRDRQQALLGAAAAERLLARGPRLPLVDRLRCIAARLVPAVSPAGCDARQPLPSSR